mgnify:CR=1 FL=1
MDLFYLTRGFMSTKRIEVLIMSKQTTPKVSTLAAKVLAGAKPTQSQVKTLAASVLSQDEKKGQK